VTALQPSPARRLLPTLTRERVYATLTMAASLAVFFALWQWYGTRPDAFAVPPPTKVLPALWESLVHGDLVSATGGALAATGAGYLIAAVIGVGGGIIIGVSQGWVRNTIEPLAYAAYSAPITVLIPVLGIYTGLGFRGIVTLVVLWSVFEILISTLAGVREVPQGIIEVARSFGASKSQTYLRVILPSAFPLIVVGLRMGIGRALRGAVTAQLLLAVTYVGKILSYSGATFDMPTLIGTIVFLTLLGLVLMKIAEFFERRLLAWRHTG
jgi:ABC-type nitrate/sulfonate/bicarbonate transport system permease component